MKTPTFTTRERALLDLHHRLANTNDECYEPEQLREIAATMAEVRRLPDVPSAGDYVNAAWGAGRQMDFVRAVRRAKLKDEVPPLEATAEEAIEAALDEWEARNGQISRSFRRERKEAIYRRLRKGGR